MRHGASSSSLSRHLLQDSFPSLHANHILVPTLISFLNSNKKLLVSGAVEIETEDTAGVWHKGLLVLRAVKLWIASSATRRMLASKH